MIALWLLEIGTNIWMRESGLGEPFTVQARQGPVKRAFPLRSLTLREEKL
jgi:hypothetical protein